MRRNKFSVAILAIATFVVLAGGAFASGFIITSIHQIKPSVRAKLRGASGPSGIASIITVDSPEISLPPGGISGQNDLIAQCPAGSTVVGTGFFDSIANTGFVEKFGTFVGGFMFNNTSVTANHLKVQAICASGPGVVDHAARAASTGSERTAFDRAYNAAKATTLKR